jgi:2',3'-cyclic-nucleotide 2'-phosphodiesterase (5'-nucleotidase family)
VYDDSTIGYMVDSGFVSGWKGNYITSNTVNTTTQVPIGSQYVVLEGENAGTKILVMGFLYHQTDNCDSVTVIDPQVSVTEPWWNDAMVEAGSVDAVVVLSHMDLSDPNTLVLLNAIRDVHPNLPVQFLTGHTHYRGFSKLDHMSSSFEAGHYLDTLGYVSFDLPAVNDTAADIYFNFQYVDANLDALYNFTGTSEDTFDTDEGLSIAQAIDATSEALGLKEVLGCFDTEYAYSSGLNTPNSLYSLYLNTILPNAVNDISTGTNNDVYHVTSTGTLRYDIYVGEFYYDDVFAVAPFANTFVYLADVTGAEISAVVAELVGASGFKDPFKDFDESMQPMAGLPSYVGGPYDADAATTYDLFFNDFDQENIVQAIATVRGVAADDVWEGVKSWRNDMSGADYVDTTTCWAKNVQAFFPCE